MKPLLLIATFLFSSLLYYTLTSPRSVPAHTPSSLSTQDCPQSYALMIDAGSTGSRLHLYKFINCPTATLPQLHSESFFSTKPGLSSYANHPNQAAESLREMMQLAIGQVPLSERACTKLELKATAGLRLLGEAQAKEILDETERWLKAEWPFQLDKGAVSIMEGRDEGVYAWITINFLLNLIGPSPAPSLPASSTPISTGSAAIMDLGGASTQIVFEPSFPIPHASSPNTPLALLPGEHVYDLTFAGKDYVLYQYSHLGYGLMQARRSVNNLVAFNWFWREASKGHAPVQVKVGTHKTGVNHSGPIEWDDLDIETRIPNPCMYKGATKVVELDPPGRSKKSVTMVGTGMGFEACRRVVEVMLAKDSVCDVEPCAFAGVYQPSLTDVFLAGKVWALSYFTDRLLPLDLPTPFTISDLRHLTKTICSGPASPAWKAQFHPSTPRPSTKSKAELAEGLKELEGRPESCLDFTFMLSLLSFGYELEEEREVFIGKKVRGVELGWSLGAAIAMVTNGEVSCRADTASAPLLE